MSYLSFHALEFTVWLAIGLLMVGNLPCLECPFGCSCGCRDGGPCLCAKTHHVAAVKGTIEEAETVACNAECNCVVRVGGMSADGIADAVGGIVCDVKAVEGEKEPCVFVGYFRNGSIHEWRVFRRQPAPQVQFVPQFYAPPPMMFFGGGCGFGGCCGGG